MVGDALYFSDWLGADKKFKTSMLYMMSRSTRQLEFTAGKFVPLVLATFLSVRYIFGVVFTNILSYLLQILRGSYSFSAFLNKFDI